MLRWNQQRETFDISKIFSFLILFFRLKSQIQLSHLPNKIIHPQIMKGWKTKGQHDMFPPQKKRKVGERKSGTLVGKRSDVTCSQWNWKFCQIRICSHHGIKLLYSSFFFGGLIILVTSNKYMPPLLSNLILH